MTNHNLWYFSQTISTPTTQENIGPFTTVVNGRIIKASVHAQLSVQSSNPSVPFVSVNDILWGLQWVLTGNAPENVQTSAVTDNWLWRHAVGTENTARVGWGPSTTSGTTQGEGPLTEVYRGQGIKPAGSIDIYISYISNFGITSEPNYVGGSVELWSS